MCGANDAALAFRREGFIFQKNTFEANKIFYKEGKNACNGEEL
jgi:hypothetical protein